MEHKFLLDGMLGSLTRWLRLLGYDTIYLKNENDHKLIEIAESEDRILLTRDELLVKIAKKKGIKSYYITKNNDKEALNDVVSEYNMIFNTEKIRCPICNSFLKNTDKNNIKNMIPEKVFNKFYEFWICDGCKKIYWKGTHWPKILTTINNAIENKNNK
ncbi:Mut7-C RNAse domain-containing protein [Candidatus Bathyarchaeota archaeon]|nr:Mut7-C RNAse domain-containing protein [Candidatus Bathyarchaeota archaeon]